MPNALHDLAWDDPKARSWRWIASAETLLPLDRVARVHLRRWNHRLAVHTLQAPVLTTHGTTQPRRITREYRRRWSWWPYALLIVDEPLPFPFRGSDRRGFRGSDRRGRCL